VHYEFDALTGATGAGAGTAHGRRLPAGPEAQAPRTLAAAAKDQQPRGAGLGALWRRVPHVNATVDRGDQCCTSTHTIAALADRVAPAHSHGAM